MKTIHFLALVLPQFLLLLDNDSSIQKKKRARTGYKKSVPVRKARAGRLVATLPKPTGGEQNKREKRQRLEKPTK